LENPEKLPESVNFFRLWVCYKYLYHTFSDMDKYIKDLIF